MKPNIPRETRLRKTGEGNDRWSRQTGLSHSMVLVEYISGGPVCINHKTIKHDLKIIVAEFTHYVKPKLYILWFNTLSYYVWSRFLTLLGLRAIAQKLCNTELMKCYVCLYESSSSSNSVVKSRWSMTSVVKWNLYWVVKCGVFQPILKTKKKVCTY